MQTAHSVLPRAARLSSRCPRPPPLLSSSFRTSPSPRLYNSSATPLPLSHPSPTPFKGPPSKGYGQPLPSTHPHLLASGELTPGIQASEYEQRRRKLVEGLEEGAVVVIAGGKMLYMTQNILHVSVFCLLPRLRLIADASSLAQLQVPPAEQLLVSDRLRGARRCSRSPCVLVFRFSHKRNADLLRSLPAEKDSSPKGYRMTMFVKPKEPYDELWNGAKTGIDGACQVFGADDVRLLFPLSPPPY